MKMNNEKVKLKIQEGVQLERNITNKKTINIKKSMEPQNIFFNKNE